MKLILLFVVILASFSSCLRNLNVSEFFRKLEIKAPGYYEIINGNRDAFEAAITKEIEKEEEGEVEWVTFWGESRYACGGVIEDFDGDHYVVVLGEYKMKGSDRSSTYSISFIPDEKAILTNSILESSW